MRKKKVIDYFFGPNFVYKSDTFFIKKSQLTNVLRHLLIRHLSGSNLSLTWLAFYTTLKERRMREKMRGRWCVWGFLCFQIFTKSKKQIGTMDWKPKTKTYPSFLDLLQLLLPMWLINNYTFICLFC